MDRYGRYPPAEGPENPPGHEGAADPWRDWPRPQPEQAPAYPPQPPAYPPQAPGWYPAPPAYPGQPPYPPRPPEDQPPGWGAPPGPPPMAPAPRTRMSFGQWVLAYVAVILALMMCFLVVDLTTRNHLPTGRQTDAVFATDTPLPTATPSPTALPTPTLIPQSGVGDHMQLGADCTAGATGFVVVDPKGQFAATDPLASVTILDHDFGTTNVAMFALRVNVDGSETEVTNSQSVVHDPAKNELCVKFSKAGDSVAYSLPGVYKLELKTDQTILAQVTFNYLG